MSLISAPAPIPTLQREPFMMTTIFQPEVLRLLAMWLHRTTSRCTGSTGTPKSAAFDGGQAPLIPELHSPSLPTVSICVIAASPGTWHRGRFRLFVLELYTTLLRRACVGLNILMNSCPLAATF
mmetsp:Transcript_96198/g.200949  ORF Transcript_96198/g.200949 Transcript_96198/m.200949 type:complete len:124 (+) Transcript_96198:1343-1714(+)